jgi:hypothetical protein
MIAIEIAEQIQELLRQGQLSQRKIARRFGISRNTVGAIARRTRPIRQPVKRIGSDDGPLPTGPLERCPGCGGMVHMPCLACRIRAIRERRIRQP